MDSNEKELTLTPIAGKSGKAFMGTYPDGGKVFVKMNTTPILAGLAKEQIAPQLLWSRRLPDGNVMSAQEWLNGEILTPNGMGKKQVVHILTRLHRSRPLMTQLRKLGYTAESPLDLLNSLSSQLPIALRQNNYLQSVLKSLRQTVPAFREDYATIVHGDVRHSNWIETDSGFIYLVDWDSVRLTDRMMDVAHVLSHYIPDSQWQDWLVYYGYKYNETVFGKLYWFGQYSFLCQIVKYYENNDLVDLFHLKNKVEAGTDFLASQMFFDNDVFVKFKEKAEKLDIEVPLIAGIMPVTNAKQIKRIIELSKCSVPEKLDKLLEKYGNNPESMKKAGIMYASEQIIELFAYGIRGVHIYTMNKPEIAKEIMRNIEFAR